MRLIDADKLKKNFQDELCKGIACAECSMQVEGFCRVERWIDIAPTIEAEPVKHGRWLRTDAYPHRIYCSECYATFIRNDEFLKLNNIPHDYCPNCGKPMVDGGSDG